MLPNLDNPGKSYQDPLGTSVRFALFFYETYLAIFFFFSPSSSFSFLSSSILLHSFLMVSGMNGLRNGIELGVWVVFFFQFPAYMALFILPLVSFFNLFGME